LQGQPGFVKGDCTPLIVGLVRAALIPDPTKPPTDPSILDDNKIYPLASVLCERGAAVGFDSLKTVIGVLTNPAGSLSKDDPRFQMMQNLTGITITEAATIAGGLRGATARVPGRDHRRVRQGEEAHHGHPG
jgi:hypothetical protein